MCSCTASSAFLFLVCVAKKVDGSLFGNALVYLPEIYVRWKEHICKNIMFVWNLLEPTRTIFLFLFLFLIFLILNKIRIFIHIFRNFQSQVHFDGRRFCDERTWAARGSVRPSWREIRSTPTAHDQRYTVGWVGEIEDTVGSRLEEEDTEGWCWGRHSFLLLWKLGKTSMIRVLHFLSTSAFPVMVVQQLWSWKIIVEIGRSLVRTPGSACDRDLSDVPVPVAAWEEQCGQGIAAGRIITEFFVVAKSYWWRLSNGLWKCRYKYQLSIVRHFLKMNFNSKLTRARALTRTVKHGWTEFGEKLGAYSKEWLNMINHCLINHDISSPPPLPRPPSSHRPPSQRRRVDRPLYCRRMVGHGRITVLIGYWIGLLYHG